MTSAYEIQQATLELFQGNEQKLLSQKEQDSLNIYKGLVVSSMEGLTAKLFKEIYAFYTQEWREICLDYLERFPSRSAVYYKLCEQFPDFIQSEFFREKYHSNNYFHQLAQYKWFDLLIYNERQKENLENGLIQNFHIMQSDFNIPAIIAYLETKPEGLSLHDDMEETPCYLLIYRAGEETKTLVLNEFTKDFIESLNSSKSLDAVVQDFVKAHQSKIQNIEMQILELVNYLKKMKMLLV